jgi:hypothetical protein
LEINILGRKKEREIKKVPRSQNGGPNKSMANWDFLLGCHQEKLFCANQFCKLYNKTKKNFNC